MITIRSMRNPNFLNQTKTMKTKTISVIAALSLLPLAGFAQPPAPPNPPNQPVPPTQPIPPIPPPKDRDRDRDKGPKVPVTFLGVETSSVPRVVSEQLGLAKGFGLVVDYVVPDGPAAAAGVQQSDILKMLNDQILMEPDQLAKLIRSYSEGTNVVLTVLRKGQETKITVKLGKKEVSSRQNLFGPDSGKHRHDDLGFNFNFEDMPDLTSLSNLSDLSSLSDLKDLKNIGPSIRDAVNEARREALQASREARREAMKATKEARREAMRESGEARREALRAADEARRAARQFRVFSTDNGAVKSTKIDLNKAQITVTDPSGEMRIEKVNGKKMLTAKDPQGRLLFSGPVDSKEELDKVPADVRQRYDKLEQKDLPGVISTASTDSDEEADDDSDSDNNDQEADNDSDNDNSDDSDAPVQQVSYRAFPRAFWTLNAVLI
jgi:vacuolar-type H+-ATPase subunit H